jgi:hypothetical protein
MTALPVLYVVACGARPAADVPEFVTWLKGRDWDTCVIVTPSALRFADVNRLTDLTGHPVRSDYKRPEDPDALPPANAFVVAPCTFNTVNKWAAGISDTLALGLLNEALCSGTPITAVPNPNVTLARHPAFKRNVEFLRDCGVHVLFDPDRYPLPTPNLGEASRDLFPWSALKAAVTEMRIQVHLSNFMQGVRGSAACTGRSAGPCHVPTAAVTGQSSVCPPSDRVSMISHSYTCRSRPSWIRSTARTVAVSPRPSLRAALIALSGPSELA